MGLYESVIGCRFLGVLPDPARQARIPLGALSPSSERIEDKDESEITPSCERRKNAPGLLSRLQSAPRRALHRDMRTVPTARFPPFPISIISVTSPK